jgi:hypothetical protein
MTGLVGGVVVALGLWFASPALAAFPGADGLLAVQPTSGGGILLVGANGRVVRRVCTSSTLCGTPRRPRWSPDGRAIVFAGPAIRIVYADGSCMNCEFGAAPSPAFKPGGGAISFIQSHYVTLDGIDGLRKPYPRLGTATDAVWSAGADVAVVRGRAVWAGPPGKLRRLASGGEPSWAPSGDAIAVVQAGWVVIIGARGGRVRRLARGSAPAFSPDGRSIAFVAPDDRLMIIPARGGHARAVGHVRALSVDWQPKPRGPNPGCAAPPGSTVLASTSSAIVTADGAPPTAGDPNAPLAYMGCLRTDGRERLLERFTDNGLDVAEWINSAVLAAPYAALVAESGDLHYGGGGVSVQVFDLRTGNQRKDLGGEGAGCPGYIGGSCAGLSQILLGSDGVSAAQWATEITTPDLTSYLDSLSCAPASTLCVANDPGLDDLLTAADPAAGQSGWTSGKLFAAVVPTALACPSQSLCIGAGTEVYASSDPAGGVTTWTVNQLPGEPASAVGVSCPSVSLCVVTRQDGSIDTSTNPAGGAGAWNAAQLVPGHALGLPVCSAAPRCFIPDADTANTVYTSADPTGGAQAWTVSSGTPAFYSGACPTTSLCVTVHGSEIATTTNPDRGEWTQQTTPDQLYSVSCPSASLCVAVGAQGALYVSTDPASGTWTRTTIDGGVGLGSVSCASDSLCVAAGGMGNAVVSTDPSGGASTWVATQVVTGPCAGAVPCTVEQIQASDATGLHIFDDSEFPGSGPFLTGLTLNGDTLSWSHDGSPRSVELTSPR